MKKGIQTKDVVVRVGFALAIGLILTQIPIFRWEARFFNARFQIHGSREPLKNIVLIGFDDKTIQGLKQPFPPTIEQHATTLNRLMALKPRGIGITYDLSEVYKNTDEQRMLSEMLPDEHVPLIMEADPNGFAPKSLSPHLAAHFKSAIPGLTRDNKSFARDQVSRRLVTHYNEIPSFETQLAQLVDPNPRYRGSYLNDRFQGAVLKEVFINWDGPAQTYRSYSFIDIYNGSVTLPDLKDAVVVLGRMDFLDMEESRFNPFETALLTLSKVEAKAQTVASLIRNNTLIEAPEWTNIMLSIAAALIASLITMGSNPMTGVLQLASFICGILALSQLSFSIGGIALNTIHPLLSILITYYLYVPYRLTIEYRKRFYYQKQNDMLKQVEELKTNFISLMSHDIKTPIAKIQGLAESGLRQAGRNSEKFNSLFSSIVNSSEELTRFVNSILDLSRLESGAIKLSMVSKDINDLVRDCVKKADFHAHQKNVKIETELEPLFSFSMDPALIRQVIQNLLENALKYCNSNSTIVIRTKEVGDFMEFSISDQGSGINPEDIDHLFERFYRPKSALEKTNVPSGVGLGLYLVKYFVELHHGKVSVESTLGQGSTFKFNLPFNSETQTIKSEELPQTSPPETPKEFSYV